MIKLLSSKEIGMVESLRKEGYKDSKIAKMLNVPVSSLQPRDSLFFSWLRDQKEYGLCNPPMDGETALGMISKYLLGEDFYDPNPESQEQVNTYFVYHILLRYSKKFRKEKRVEDRRIELERRYKDLHDE